MVFLSLVIHGWNSWIVSAGPPKSDNPLFQTCGKSSGNICMLMGKFPYYHVQKSYSDFHRFDQCELTCPTNNAWWYSAWWFNMGEMLIATSSKKIIFETHQIWIQKASSKGCNSFIKSYNPWTTPTVTEISVTENTTVVSLVGSVFVLHKVGVLCIQRFPMKFPPCSTRQWGQRWPSLVVGPWPNARDLDLGLCWARRFKVPVTTELCEGWLMDVYPYTYTHMYIYIVVIL